jgi:hypothetical protein
MKEVQGDGIAPGTYQTFMIEVKYRADLSRYLTLQAESGTKSVFARVKANWPNLWVVFVTDRPGEQRSCFQALDVSAYEPGATCEIVELRSIQQFDIYSQNIEQHEHLAIKLFGLLSAVRAGY